MSSKADIAIVDSDATVRQALTLLLPAYGVTVKAFASSREFLDSLVDRWPSCLLVDLHMPDMNGFDLLEALQKMRVRVPAIVVAAECTPATVGRVTALGAIACLEKPVEASMLMNSIVAALWEKP
jgi:FixJ family two-component response regulator